ncbi:hypothetical protein [Planobispora rosea]|nr:hypothetical protein [Planobispora rosea]
MITWLSGAFGVGDHVTADGPCAGRPGPCTTQAVVAATSVRVTFPRPHLRVAADGVDMIDFREW